MRKTMTIDQTIGHHLAMVVLVQVQIHSCLDQHRRAHYHRDCHHKDFRHKDHHRQGQP